MILFLKDHPRLSAFLLCLISSVLLVSSFPKIDCGPLIWFALVPWMFAIDGKRKRAAFGWSFLTGFIFYLGAIYWFMYVTWVGAVLLMAYLALYFGAFGWVYRYSCGLSLGRKIIVCSSFWVVFEYTREHFLSGFGWVALCHSQYQNLALIQVVDITGIYGISFLIVAVNVLVKENVSFILGSSRQERKTLFTMNMIVLGVLLAAYGYGFWRIASAPALPSLKVAVVQGNIAQEDKWVIGNRTATIKKYLRLTQEAMKDSPDLVIWPETAFPGFIEEMPHLMDEIRAFARDSGVPIVLGVVTEEGDRFYNSAQLISAQGQFTDRYDKVHLVPFGEFLPLRKQLTFLADLVPIDDFSSGREAKVLRLPVGGKEARFSVAVCFEDTLAYIARRFVRGGAEFLVNITNDAWFLDSKEPFMHLQAAVFRTIETRRSLVRSANTGVSCHIDPYGRILGYVRNSQGKKTYVDGSATFNVALNTTETVYTKFGDVFTYLCFVCILWTVLKRRIRRDSTVKLRS